MCYDITEVIYMKKILFASNNLGKLNELKEIFKDYEVISPKDVGLDLDVLEDGETFLDNASKKAVEFYNAAILKDTEIAGVIADDSGLCIPALNNWPGVFTHRITDASDAVRNQMIIDRVNETKCNRACYFNCCLVYYNGQDIISANGILNGMIAEMPKGDNGFGFDSIFVLNDNNTINFNGKTLAELSNAEKNLISARKIAALELLSKLSKAITR